MGIVLLIKKKYGKNMQLLALKQTTKDKEKEMAKTELGNQKDDNKNRVRPGWFTRVSAGGLFCSCQAYTKGFTCLFSFVLVDSCGADVHESGILFKMYELPHLFLVFVKVKQIIFGSHSRK